MPLDHIDEFLRFIHQKIADATYWCFGFNAFALARGCIYLLTAHFVIAHLAVLSEETTWAARLSIDWNVLTIDAFFAFFVRVIWWRIGKDERSALIAWGRGCANPAIVDGEARRSRLCCMLLAAPFGVAVSVMFICHTLSANYPDHHTSRALFNFFFATYFTLQSISCYFCACNLPPPGARSKVFKSVLNIRPCRLRSVRE